MLALFGCNGGGDTPPDETDEEYSFDFDTYNAELRERKDYIFDYLITRHGSNYSHKFGFSVSAARIDKYLETGDQEYLDSALHQAKKCYEHLERSPDCFGISFAIHHYGLFNEYYSEELKAYAKKIFTETTVYGDRPSTTNHALMFAVGTYLANQYFPGEIGTEYYGYDAVQTDDPTAEKTLYDIVNKYPITGVYEYNSDTYFICHFLPLLAIAECSDDEVLATKARMVLHNAIFTLAPIWLKGHTAVAKERCYQPYTAENEGGAATTLLWYYFGGRDVFPNYKQLDEAESMFMGFALYSDFLPHWISVAMANDRSEIYTHLETHIYTKDRYNTTFTAFLQTYMRQDYAVYSGVNTCSLIDLYVNRYRGFDRVIWGCDWVAEDPNEKSNFSICNWDDVVTDNHTKIGCTVYSDVLQNNGTVIGVFDLPEEYDERYPDYKYPRYLTINMPTNYKAIIDESFNGKMFAHFGNILIGFKLSIPFVYKGEDHTYTNPVTKAYFVCEIVDADDVEGDTYEEQLAYFQSMLEVSFRTIEHDFSDRTKVSYRTVEGTTMELQYGGDGYVTRGVIDGVAQKYQISAWPSQSNPWVHAEIGDEIITYSYKGHSITFDFNEMKITESKKG